MLEIPKCPACGEALDWDHDELVVVRGTDMTGAEIHLGLHRQCHAALFTPTTERSTVPTVTITDFLLARIAEDEAMADRAASYTSPAGLAVDNYGYLWVERTRMLAECVAKRRIVELWNGAAEEAESRPSIIEYGPRILVERANHAASRAALGKAVHLLASVYSRHPEYNRAWELE